MKKLPIGKTKLVCYYMYLAAASVFILPPMLFNTFQEMYGISYTLLGTLVVVNFITQLSVDLIFSFFSRFFNIHKTLRITPLLTAVGLGIYALVPTLFPQHAYLGLVIGTVIFSVAAGLGEVLISPTVAALPSDNPAKDMSTLHSLYGYGFVSVVVISTIFLQVFGNTNWMYLVGFFAILPLIASGLMSFAILPDMDISHAKENTPSARKRTVAIFLCMMCIFLGSCAENSMTNWISVYTETALNIPKALGDLLGMCSFAILLSLTRTFYAKYGRNISRVLLLGMAGATVLYLTVAFCPNAIISLIACVLVGLCTSMLWPGTLILMEEKIPAVGVAAYALMAAGGDFGASVAPQLLGLITDSVSASPWALEMSASLMMAPEQLGMKVGMLVAALFPLLGTFLLLGMRRFFRRNPVL